MVLCEIGHMIGYPHCYSPQKVAMTILDQPTTTGKKTCYVVKAYAAPAYKGVEENEVVRMPNAPTSE